MRGEAIARKIFCRLSLSIRALMLCGQLRLAKSHSAASGVASVIFSMDRAMQLHALLGSFFEHKSGECEVWILYRATTKDHEAAYSDVQKQYGDRVRFVKHENRSDFKSRLMHIVDSVSAGKVFFLVDDILFTEKIDMKVLESVDTNRTIFSLRMGDHLSYSYVVQKPQGVPPLDRMGDKIAWDWNQGELDWSYPLSVDGHLFSTEEVRVWARELDYAAPNSFEGALQALRFCYAKRRGLAFAKARIVNNPCNRVQNEVGNLSGMVHPDDLLREWQNGKQIDYSRFYGHVNQSVHEELPVIFKERN